MKMLARQALSSYEKALLRYATASTDYHVSATDEGQVRWVYFRPRELIQPSQGWKIHVTAGVLEAANFVETVVP